MRLSSTRYEKLKKSAVALLIDYMGDTTFPVDIFTLAKRLGIEFIKYSEVSSDNYTALLRILGDTMKDAFLERKGEDFYIFYDEKQHPCRLRFSIAHEIAHYVFGHKEGSEKEEDEADFFARYLLAPLPLVHLMNLSTIREISDAFDISLTCAGYVYNDYQNWLNIKIKNNYYTEYESELVCMFKGKSMPMHCNNNTSNYGGTGKMEEKWFYLLRPQQIEQTVLIEKYLSHSTSYYDTYKLSFSSYTGDTYGKRTI